MYKCSRTSWQDLHVVARDARAVFSGMCDLLICAKELWSEHLGGLLVADEGECCAVAITDGRIVAAGPIAALPEEVVVGAAKRVDTDGPGRRTLMPGLIDLHCHWDPSGGSLSRYGLEPDKNFLPRGVTTVLSQGDAGADTWCAFAKALSGCRTRCLMAMNLLRVGELPSYFAGGKHAEGEDLEDFDVEACVRAIEAGGDSVWGVDLNVGHNHGSVEEMVEATRRAVEVRRLLEYNSLLMILHCGFARSFTQLHVVWASQVAERTGKPILYGMRRESDGWSFQEQLAPLRAGDVVTYVYRSTPHNIVIDGAVAPSIVAARERGLLFDVGHGGNAFDLSVAQTALAAGFPPDTISSDNHVQIPAPPPPEQPHDLLMTMAKVKAVGLDEDEVFQAVTAAPATILGLAGEIGTLQPGSCGDLCLLQWVQTEDPLNDAFGNIVRGPRFNPLLTIREGEIVFDALAAASNSTASAVQRSKL